MEWLLLLLVVELLKPAAQEAIRRVNTALRGISTTLELWAIGGGYYLRSDAASAFTSMRKAAFTDGVTLDVNSAWRTNDEQAALYADYVAGLRTKPVAPPGFSNHEGGTAVDVETASGTNAAFRWLTANASRFGFRRTVSDEPWHWEYRT